MRLIRNLVVDLFLILLWPLRALLRLIFAARPPALASVLLKGPLRYRSPARRGLFRFGGKATGVSLERLQTLAQRLIESPKTLGLLVELQGVVGTAAQWAELSRILATLKAAHKKVAIYSEDFTGTAYGAVCGADVLVLPPSGDLRLVGVGTELMSIGAGLQKLGVRPRFSRRESYKTAPELFTEAAPSPAQLETVDRLLDRSFAALKESLTKRGLSSEDAGRAIDRGPYSGRTALAAKLIDEAAFRDQVPNLLRTATGAAPAPAGGSEWLPPLGVLERTSRLAPLKLRPLRPPRSVAVVPLTGTIASGESRNMPGFGALIGSETAVAALAAARKDRRCPSALVTIDSRGGSALASEIVWRELVRLAGEKPTVVYVDSVAASGGYLIACGAPRILAAPLAIVGSIGVFSGHFDFSGLLSRLGVRRDFVGRGARAGLTRSGPLTVDEWEAMEALTDDIYASFMKIVADARHLSPETVRGLAQGKVYTGAEAKGLGLIDEVCSFREAALEVRRLGKLAEDADLRVFGDRASGQIGELLRRFAAGAVTEAAARMLRGRDS